MDMRAFPEFPQSAAQVLEGIVRAERLRRFVWTAGRVVQERGLRAKLRALSIEDQKLVLKGLRALLKDLAEQGVLERRAARQSVRNGDEVAFDYVGRPRGGVAG